MDVHISYKFHKTPDIEKDINHLLEKLNRRLHAFRPELVHLKGVVDQNSPRKGFIVSLNLRLPSGQMAVQQSAPTASEAVKRSFDDLLHQLNKHKELLRNSHKWPRRWHVASVRPGPEVPFEQTFASVHPTTVSSDDVRSYVNVNLARLERFIDRELRFREDAEISGESISREEIVDEVVARALGDGEEKPDLLAIEPWLYRLALNAMNDLCALNQDDMSSVRLEDSARTPNVRASSEPELQFHQPDETLTEESIIADRRVSTPEDIASTDEMMTLVQFALGRATRTEREAFILHAIEGFSVEEIAAITDRKADQVRLSIVAARDHLRRSPPLATRFRDQPLRNTGTG